jgi:hypothetical protein
MTDIEKLLSHFKVDSKKEIRIKKKVKRLMNLKSKQIVFYVTKESD